VKTRRPLVWPTPLSTVPLPLSTKSTCSPREVRLPLNVTGEPVMLTPLLVK
jgi:hypothetical protein